MTSSVMLAGYLIAGFVSVAAAQSFNDRFGLHAIAGQSSPSDAAFAITFIDSPPVCPERHGALQIASGTIWLIRSPHPAGGGGISKAADDETYEHRMLADDCVINITVRAQVYRDARWVSLLVPRWMRPSLSPAQRLSPEDRRSLEHWRRLLEVRRQGIVDPQAETTTREAWLQGPGNLPRMVRIRQLAGGFSSFYEFEGAPESCVEAVGEYLLDQRRITFHFPTNFPDDINRFDVEFHRFDDFRGQLVFVRGDCRVELTVGKAVRDHGRWLPIPISSIARSK
jgi:hypothetical protein